MLNWFKSCLADKTFSMNLASFSLSTAPVLLWCSAGLYFGPHFFCPYICFPLVWFYWSTGFPVISLQMMFKFMSLLSSGCTSIHKLFGSLDLLCVSLRVVMDGWFKCENHISTVTQNVFVFFSFEAP